MFDPFDITEPTAFENRKMSSDKLIKMPLEMIYLSQAPWQG